MNKLRDDFADFRAELDTLMHRVDAGLSQDVANIGRALHRLNNLFIKLEDRLQTAMESSSPISEAEPEGEPKC